MQKKLRLLNFTKKRKERYSERWLLKVSPTAIANYIQKKREYTISCRAALAIAKAHISICYRDLVLQEEKDNLKEEIMEGKCEEKK